MNARKKSCVNMYPRKKNCEFLMSATFEIFECVLPQLIKNMRSDFFNFLNTRASIPANHLKVARSKKLAGIFTREKKVA